MVGGAGTNSHIPTPDTRYPRSNFPHHRDHHLCGGDVGGEGDVVDVADAHEALDVGVVRVGGEGIDDEDDGLAIAGGDEGGDLRIAAERAGEEAFDGEAGGLGDASAGGAGADEMEFAQRDLVVLTEGDQCILLAIVCDESECGHEEMIAGGRGQRAEVRGQRSEIRGQRSEVRC